MSLSPGFWDDNARATGTMKEIKLNEYWIHLFKAVELSVEDFAVLFEFWKAGEASEEEAKVAFDDAVLNKQYRDLFYTKIPRALRFNDRISMAFSTELREPFLDYRLVELAFSLPLEFKIKNGISKYMLREIASEYLANDLVFAPKRALQTPQREWLAEDLKDWVGLCFNEIENSKFRDWFDIDALKKELDLYFEGNSQSSFHIWQCISLYEML